MEVKRNAFYSLGAIGQDSLIPPSRMNSIVFCHLLFVCLHLNEYPAKCVQALMTNFPLSDDGVNGNRLVDETKENLLSEIWFYTILYI